MNRNEKKIFYSVFTFNLLCFIAIMAIFIVISSASLSYLAESFPEYNSQISWMSSCIVFIIVTLALTKIKSLYMNTKKTTLNYFEKMKDN